MNPMKRPRKPKGWATRVNADRDKLAELQQNEAPLNSEHFNSRLWRMYAICWEKAQSQLCGYCTGTLVHGGGSIDHYRPKSEYTRIIECVGSERSGSIGVQGRQLRPKPALQPAWPELAYEWDNYVYSCERCNVGWKRTLFPARDPKTGQVITGRRRPEEEPLLLSPFDLTDPRDHFEFEDAGYIRGRSLKGQQTIAVCGLDRLSLVEDRRRHFEPWLRVIDDLTREGLPEAERAKAVLDVVDVGQWTRPYAAMWRDIVRRAEQDWLALEQEASVSRPPPAGP